MRALLRLMLLLVLSVAVPFQGYAAVAMPACAQCLPEDNYQFEAMPATGSQAHAAHCMQHAQKQAKPQPTNPGMKHDQCAGHCAVCSTASPVTAITANTASLPAMELPSQSAIVYRPAYFYRLTAPPLERPPLPQSV